MKQKQKCSACDVQYETKLTTQKTTVFSMKLVVKTLVVKTLVVKTLSPPLHLQDKNKSAQYATFNMKRN